MGAYKAKVNEQGRVVIPAELRDAAGIRPGDEVFVSIAGPGRLELSTHAADLEEAKAIVRRFARKSDRSVVDELIEERKAEAARE